MRLLVFLLAACLAFLPRAFAQDADKPRGQDADKPRFSHVDPAPLPAPQAAPLPDLGDAGASELSLQNERRIGESVMRDIRRDGRANLQPARAGADHRHPLAGGFSRCWCGTPKSSIPFGSDSFEGCYGNRFV